MGGSSGGRNRLRPNRGRNSDTLNEPYKATLGSAGNCGFLGPACWWAHLDSNQERSALGWATSPVLSTGKRLEQAFCLIASIVSPEFRENLGRMPAEWTGGTPNDLRRAKAIDVCVSSCQGVSASAATSAETGARVAASVSYSRAATMRSLAGRLPRSRRAATDTTRTASPRGRGLAVLSGRRALARRILKAARRLVAKDGYQKLSLQNVADASGVPKSAVAYHFGDKAGLISSLTESLIHDVNTAVVQTLEVEPPSHDRVHQVLCVQRQVVEATAYWRLLFALVPEINKDKRLRARFDDLMVWYQQVVLRSLGLWRDGETNEQGRQLVSLMLAVLEGLALQHQLFPGRSDLDSQFSLWESIITPHIDRLLGQAGASVDGHVDGRGAQAGK